MADTPVTNNKLNKDGLSTLLSLLNATLAANFAKVNEKLAEMGGEVADTVTPEGTTAVSGKAVNDFVTEKTDALDTRLSAIEESGVDITLADEVTETGTGAVTSAGIFSFVTSKIDEVNAGGVVLSDEVTEDGENAVKGSGIYAFVKASIDDIANLTSEEITEIYNGIVPESYFTEEVPAD